ncbi:hypothetical protein [Saccharopolyspora rosea]|uniref:Uncharacterized protein n=1 Tax=Saccharopolyspora rosea TaxID=524884 RepID=A0ABW3FQV1_9PSEU|nr:hypothetical protein [Saccharopolyspora rosea]
MRTLGDLLMVLVLPLVVMLVGAVVFCVVLAQGWGLPVLLG